MNPNQKMDQTFWFEHQSIPKFNGLRQSAENVKFVGDVMWLNAVCFQPNTESPFFLVVGFCFYMF